MASDPQNFTKASAAPLLMIQAATTSRFPWHRHRSSRRTFATSGKTSSDGFTQVRVTRE
jgi:hypothetical protein